MTGASTSERLELMPGAEVESVRVTNRPRWGLTPDCPLILDLNPDYRCRELTDAERQHVANCGFCKSWIKKFESKRSRPDEGGAIGALLEEVGAVECFYDYGLPSGMRCDTFVDASKLCASEEAMGRVAAAFDEQFADVSFDTIVANGWPMAMIGRRLASLRMAARQARVIPVVISEGYAPHLTFKEDIAPDAKVLMLVDTVVTGTHLNALREETDGFKAHIVGSGALFVPRISPVPRDAQVKWLCEVDMEICEAPSDQRPLFGATSRKEFHPVSHCMITRTDKRFNVTELLNDPMVRELWESVEQAGAYKHHHKKHPRKQREPGIEKTKQDHYLGFIDTMMLLKHREIGPRMVSRLRELLEDRFPFPDVILVPKRPRQERSKKLAEMLVKALKEAQTVTNAPIIYARFADEDWVLAPGDRTQLAGRAVLVLDVAAGHGATIDRLTRLARSASAAGVGAAVLISRLDENCEVALDRLFDHGFCRVYNFPVRPVRVTGPSNCPACKRLQHIREIERAWEICLSPRGGGERKGDKPQRVNKHAREVHLYRFADPFFANCSSAVASGVVLHALHSVKASGIGQFEMPELYDQEVPPRTRQAMLERIPPGVLKAGWNAPLEQDIADFLKGYVTLPDFWACGPILAQEGKVEWVKSVENVLRGKTLRRNPQNKRFWAKVTYLIDLTTEAAKDVAAAAKQLRTHLVKLRDQYPQFKDPLDSAILHVDGKAA